MELEFGSHQCNGDGQYVLLREGDPGIRVFPERQEVAEGDADQDREAYAAGTGDVAGADVREHRNAD